MASTVNIIRSLRATSDIPKPFGGVDVRDWSPPQYELNNGFFSKTIDKVWSGIQTLAAGTLTVDLTTLASTGLPTTDFTNDSILVFSMENLGVASINVKVGATNGYTMFTASGVDVHAGSGITLWSKTGYAAVSATLKTLLFTGTGTDSFRMALVGGI